MGCCKGKKSYPYYDNLAMMSLIFGCIGFFTSWVFYGTFLVCVVAFALQQCCWCIRNFYVLFAAITFTGLAGLAEIGTGIWTQRAYAILSDAKTTVYCQPFVYAGSEVCSELAYAIVCYISGAFWMASFFLLLCFWVSGKYAIVEEKFKSEANGGGNDVEQQKEPAKE